VKGVKFWDGGLVNNNPIDEVWNERGYLFPHQPTTCVIILGTGVTEQRPPKSILPVIGKGKRILENVTDVQRVHIRFKGQMENERVEYFRFNPNTANDDIGLADYKKLDTLERHTISYLSREEVKTQISRCALLLVRRSEEPGPLDEAYQPE
jgi:hypothetical protein